jgi:hypothetical protein
LFAALVLWPNATTVACARKIASTQLRSEGVKQIIKITLLKDAREAVPSTMRTKPNAYCVHANMKKRTLEAERTKTGNVKRK